MGEGGVNELDSTTSNDAGSLTPSQELGSLGSVLMALARTEPVALAPGTLVADQYRIVRPIGEGGMGVVFLARDTRLDRDVAVKLCTGLSPAAVHRIQREAMALAKLAHPNVVVVFQAGELDGRFFIAMEHVAGGTARTWLAAAERGPREIVALYLGAGEGLAAAHAAGLVHRDFKPDNVLVGADGRPRVADFGLVRAIHGASREPGASTVGPGSSTTTNGDDELATRAGAVMGTPAYMPPEQLAGAELDARADQYAFAASLWEALMGWRPAHASHEQAAEVPRHVPRHWVVALRRALAERPADRWPDLEALLATLRRDPAATRRRVVMTAAALGLTAAVTGVAVAMTTHDAPPPCEDGDARIEAVWSPARRTALAPAVGEVAWPAIEQRVQARASAWVSAYAQVCRATRIDAVADEATFHRRMLCLESQRDELDATLAALQSGSRTAVGHAVEAIDSLPTSEPCLQLEARPSEKPLPSDPQERVEIARVQRAVAEARAAVLDPALLDAAGKAEHAVALARATQWAPVIASALSVRGRVAYEDDHLAVAVASYEEATALALAAGYDALGVEALVGSAWSLAEVGRIPEATYALRMARNLWVRLGEPAYEQRTLLGAEAHVALRDHRPHDGLAKTREQIALTEQAQGLPATQAADDQYNLALALEQASELDEAKRAIARAIALAREALGDAHPTVAQYQGLAARIEAGRGDFDAVIELATRVLEIDERWFGPNDPRLGIALDLLGEAARQQGRPADAVAFWRRHLALRRRHDPYSSTVPMLEINLAIVAAQQGDFAGAAPLAAEALAGLERRYGSDDPALIQALVLTGYIARERPAPDLVASERDLARALAISDSRLGSEHTETINTEIELANTHVAAGRAAQAVERLERRLPRLADLELPRDQPAGLRYTLARALVATEVAGATARACMLAREADEILRKLQGNVPSVEPWRAQHCHEGDHR